MYLWPFSSDDPAKNLALDEALLDVLDQAAADAISKRNLQNGDVAAIEVLRLWQMPIACVVLGRSSRVAQEVNATNCNSMHVPILRRCSGGTTILAGMGCAMYSVFLSLEHRSELAMIDRAHQFVMSRLQTALNTLGLDVALEGICDLTFEGKKISGNALRLKRHTLLYHGTILYSFDLSLMQTLLGWPARQPDYRKSRTHLNFVSNVPVGLGELNRQLRLTFGAIQDWSEFPFRNKLDIHAEDLLRSRYSQSEWNLSR